MLAELPFDVDFLAAGFFAADVDDFLAVEAVDLRVDAVFAAGFFAVAVRVDAAGFFAAALRVDAAFAAGFFAAGFLAAVDFADVDLPDEPAARVRDDEVDFFAVDDELFALDELRALDARFFGAGFPTGEGSLLRASDTAPPTALPASPTTFPAFPMMSTRSSLPFSASDSRHSRPH